MSEEMQVPRRRVSRILGQRIIKQGFQFKFSLVIFTFLAVAALVVWLEGRYVVNHMVDTGAVTDANAVYQLRMLNQTVALTSILALAIVFGLSIFFSYFIAGPIYRFEKTLEAMSEGDLTVRVSLRKYDEFKEVAEKFNQALASLRNKLKQERETHSPQIKI